MKIRGVKPDFWTDEKVVNVSPFARLLFIGLWNLACDNGHVEDRPRQIKMRILPADDVDVSALLDELASEGLVERIGGWIVIENLPHHQRIDKRFFVTCSRDECVRPASKTSSARRDHDEHATGPHDDGDGDGDGEPVRLRRRPKRPAPKDWKPNAHHTEVAAASQIDLIDEARRFLDHHASKGNTFADWDRAFNTWLSNAQKWRKPAGHNGTVRQNVVVDKNGVQHEVIW